MIGLADGRDYYADQDFTPESQLESFTALHESHGMPFDLSPRSAVPATVPACREVVAVREHAGEALAGRLLRELRLQQMARGGVLDELHTLREASHAAGIDSDELDHWSQAPRTANALEADFKMARSPHAIALRLEGRLGSWEGGLRYSAPSYVLTGGDDDRVAVIPGLNTAQTYDVAFANFAPELERAATPDDAGEVLRWAGAPLATAEVAAVMELGGLAEAREALAAAGASEHPLGNDALWTI